MKSIPSTIVIDEEQRRWKYCHHGWINLIIAERKDGFTITVEHQRTTTLLLRLPVARAGLDFEDKIKVAVSVLWIMRSYLEIPPDMSAKSLKHMIDQAYDTVM